MPTSWLVTAAAFTLLNLLTFAAFARDKRAAMRRAPRVPEASLLFLAALGGTPAALVGQRMLRHKTSKQPFARRLALIALVQMLLAAALLVRLAPIA